MSESASPPSRVFLKHTPSPAQPAADSHEHDTHEHGSLVDDSHEHDSASEDDADQADQADGADGLGKVTSIGRVVDPQTGNLPVRILLDNARGRIAVGQTVGVSIIVHEHADELVVPSAAMIDLGEGPLLLVVREGKAAHLHPTSVATHGTWTIILGTDLEAGEAVIIEGGFNLPEEIAVIVESESPAPAGEAEP